MNQVDLCIWSLVTFVFLGRWIIVAMTMHNSICFSFIELMCKQFIFHDKTDTEEQFVRTIDLTFEFSDVFACITRPIEYPVTVNNDLVSLKVLIYSEPFDALVRHFLSVKKCIFSGRLLFHLDWIHQWSQTESRRTFKNKQNWSSAFSWGNKIMLEETMLDKRKRERERERERLNCKVTQE